MVQTLELCAIYFTAETLRALRKAFFHLPLRGRQVKRSSALRGRAKSRAILSFLSGSPIAEDRQTNRLIYSYKSKISFCLPPSQRKAKNYLCVLCGSAVNKTVID